MVPAAAPRPRGLAPRGRTRDLRPDNGGRRPPAANGGGPRAAQLSDTARDLRPELLRAGTARARTQDDCPGETPVRPHRTPLPRSGTSAANTLAGRVDREAR